MAPLGNVDALYPFLRVVDKGHTALLMAMLMPVLKWASRAARGMPTHILPSLLLQARSELQAHVPVFEMAIPLGSGPSQLGNFNMSAKSRLHAAELRQLHCIC